MQTLDEFKATHEVSTDFELWEQHVPVHESATTLRIHIYRDRSGSPFTILEQITLSSVPRRWFEYDWHQGETGKRDTLDEAVAALYQEYAVDAIGATA